MGRTSKHKLWIPKFLDQNGHFLATKKVLSRHGSYLCRSALIVACSFLSQHIFMLYSFILLRHNLTLSRHNSIDVVCFMSRHGCLLLRQKFPPSALQICCNSFCYVATFFLLLFSIYVATVFLLVAWICCRDRLFLCCDSVVLPCIVETELRVAIPCRDRVVFTPFHQLNFLLQH